MIKRRLYLILLLFLLVSCLVFLIALSYRMGIFSLSEDGNMINVFSGTDTPTASPSPLPSPTPTPTPLPEVRIKQGDWQIFTGDYEKAKEEYLNAQQASENNETVTAAKIGLAHTELLYGDVNEAINSLNSIIENDPDNPQIARAYFFLGQAYQQQSEPVLAAAAYNQYLTLQPGTIDAYIQELLGDMLLASGDYTGAINIYQIAAQASEPNIDQTSLLIKIGRTYQAMNDSENAIRIFMDIYNSSSNDYLKAQMNLLTGQIYLSIGIPEQAYARFQDSVTNYPKAYDSYSGLVALVEAGIPVSDLDRGIVDFYAGQYAVGLDALNRYIQANPDTVDGTAQYYKALCLQALERYDEAIAVWNAMIRERPEDRYWVDCWEDIAYTQYFYQNNYYQASETYLGFVRERPTAPEAPGMLFSAGRFLESDNRLAEAAAVWERLIVEYPNNELSYRALFLAGISYYRLNEFAQSQTVFQRLLVLATTPDEQAAAYLWIGKNLQGLNDQEGARSSWELASIGSPSSYYGIRTGQLLAGQPPFPASQDVDLAVDMVKERAEAEEWLRSKFSITPETDFSSYSAVLQDERLKRADTYWHLGLYTEAHYEIESLRDSYQYDAISSFVLMEKMLDFGFYRSAILTDWNILKLANIDESTAFTVPVYFNHIRYGTYFKDKIAPIAQEYDFDLLLFFSIIRQESLFEGFVESTAGARGLMQIMPETGKEIATQTGWPTNYQESDLYRPKVNLEYGAHYLARQREYFDGDMYIALAAYNGGPGNAINWQKTSSGDPDLFLETIRYSETRDYIIYITENLYTYQKIYERAQ